MPRWENREGTPPEQRLKELSEEMSIENLIANKALNGFPPPEEIKELQFQLVNSAGNLFLVTKLNGQKVRVQFQAY